MFIAVPPLVAKPVTVAPEKSTTASVKFIFPFAVIFLVVIAPSINDKSPAIVRSPVAELNVKVSPILKLFSKNRGEAMVVLLPFKVVLPLTIKLPSIVVVPRTDGKPADFMVVSLIIVSFSLRIIVWG